MQVQDIIRFYRRKNRKKTVGLPASISLLMVLFLFLGVSCSSTKMVPEGSYLLDKVSLNVDNKDINKTELGLLIKQRPNDPKFRVRIYSLAGRDSSWFKKMIRKLGMPPVIYSKQLADQSANEIHIDMINRGYLNNTVAYSVDTTARKKAKISYTVTANEPYRIRNYRVNINEQIDSLLQFRRSRRFRSLVGRGTIFDMNRLESERMRVDRIIRNRGYYDSSIDNLHYLADTTLRSNQVDLSMILLDSNQINPYYIRKISVFSGFDPLFAGNYDVVDSADYRGIRVYYDKSRFLKPGILRRNILLQPGRLYNENMVNRTYNYLSTLGSVSRTNIQFEKLTEGDTSFLDCNIYLTESNIHNIELGLDGTNKAGNLGVAANVSYTHHNVFNGAETWNIKLRGAYEFVAKRNSNDVLNDNYYEFGIQTGFSFPRIHLPFIGHRIRQRFNVNTTYDVSFDIQKRPEYVRDFFSLSWGNRWENDSRTLSQNLNLLDINYIMMPWISEEFNDYLNAVNNSLTRFSYEDIFTVGISYNLIYTNQNTGRLRQRLYTIRLNAESSGNLLSGIFSLTNAKKSPETGQYNILGNPFAQYLKGDISYSQTVHLDAKNSIAYRVMAGVGYPYGNSTIKNPAIPGGESSILPFEKRFYSGGPNSVRGWSTRYLGPGSFNEDIDNLATHVGDIKLEFNLEYRYKWIKWLEFAAFTDAGNIWTLRDYENQPAGNFQWNRFYKEIAIGAGVGLRFDLGFLIVRVDGAKRVYDPARAESARWTFLKESLRGNSALYFAIGYPF